MSIKPALFILNTITRLFTPISASAKWRQDNNGWWYTEGNSYAKGLRDINGKTY